MKFRPYLFAEKLLSRIVSFMILYCTKLIKTFAFHPVSFELQEMTLSLLQNENFIT